MAVMLIFLYFKKQRLYQGAEMKAMFYNFSDPDLHIRCLLILRRLELKQQNLMAQRT